MVVKFTPALVSIFVVLAVFGYLILTDELTKEWLLVLTILLVILLMWHTQTKTEINMWEARDIAIRTAQKLQREGEWNKGTLYIGDIRRIDMIANDIVSMPDGTRKEMKVMVPLKWRVVVLIHGTSVEGYLIEISRWGVLLGKPEIPAPTLYSLLDEAELTRVDASEGQTSMRPEDR